MKTQLHQKVSAGETFLLQHVQGLLKFAQTNQDFAESFAAAIKSKNWRASVAASEAEPQSKYCAPLEISDAVSTTHWVMNTLQTHPEFTQTRGTLALRAQQYESPKDLVLGIVGVAVIGPTLGILKSKKRKKRKSQLVFDAAYYASLSKAEVAKLATALTQQVVAKELRLAGGNVYTLHPDSAAWCIEEAATQVYTDTPENITALLKITQEENLSHTLQKSSAGKTEVLVISPSVNDAVVDETEAEVL